MKRLLLVSSVFSYFLSVNSVFAIDNISINTTAGIPSNTGLSKILGNSLTIILSVGALAVVFMLAWGAFQWITSGGDKEAVGKARGRIIAALVGLVILALAFVIVTTVGNLLGISLTNVALPNLAN